MHGCPKWICVHAFKCMGFPCLAPGYGALSPNQNKCRQAVFFLFSFLFTVMSIVIFIHTDKYLYTSIYLTYTLVEQGDTGTRWVESERYISVCATEKNYNTR